MSDSALWAEIDEAQIQAEMLVLWAKNKNFTVKDQKRWKL